MWLLNDTSILPGLRRVRDLTAGLLLALPLLASAGEAGTAEKPPSAPPPLNARFRQENSPSGGEVTRGVLVAQSNQFSFVLPPGFRAEVDKSKKRLALTATDFSCALIVQVHEWAIEGQADLKPDTLRSQVLASHPKATILDDFTATIEGQTGPGFELEWFSSQGIKMTARVAFVPCSGGHLEVALQGMADPVRERGHLLNQLLLSLRSCPLGAKLPEQSFLSDL